MPKRYHDLIHDFPIKSYTLREGKLNLASYIPDYYLKPELGPKVNSPSRHYFFDDRSAQSISIQLKVLLGAKSAKRANSHIKHTDINTDKVITSSPE